MFAYRCFFCSVRIGRKHVIHASYLKGRRHVVRLCYECGMPRSGDGTLCLTESCKTVDAKLKEIKALEVYPWNTSTG